MSNGERKARWRQELMAAQEGYCPYCGYQMVLAYGWRGTANLDHVFPLSRYAWRGHAGNLLLAHKRCNVRKTDRDPYPCEVLFLEAMNLRTGQTLRVLPSKKRARQAERDAFGAAVAKRIAEVEAAGAGNIMAEALSNAQKKKIARKVQSERDKAAARKAQDLCQ